MKYRAYLKPHEAELIEAVDFHLRAATETAQYTRKLIMDRCRHRARKDKAA
jgi:hypothetical protein